MIMGSKTGTEKGYSISALARMAGVDRRTLASRLEGVTPLESGPKGKLFRLSDVVRNFITQPLQGEDDPALLGLRARKLEAEAGLAELKLKRERGELEDRRAVAADYHEMIRHFYTLLTVTVPQRLGPRLRVATSTREAEEILRVEVEREFQEYRAECAQMLAELNEAEGPKQEEADDEER
jgi:transcriptional regulator with XRE-family HTH domain